MEKDDFFSWMASHVQRKKGNILQLNELKNLYADTHNWKKLKYHDKRSCMTYMVNKIKSMVYLYYYIFYNILY